MSDIVTLGIRVENGQVVTANDSLDKLAARAARAEGAVGLLASTAGKLGVTLGAGAIMGKFIKETIDAQNVQAQLEARLRSTGGAVGLTIGQLDKLATSEQQLTAFSDDAVKGAEAVLLAFTNIKGDEFIRAAKAAEDLATAMGGDLNTSASQLGRALQLPAEALSALNRGTRLFSESEVASIAAMAEHGKVAEAQAVILARVEERFGGAARAARDTLGGALKGLANDFGDLFELSQSSTSGVVATINALAVAMKTTVEAAGGMLNVVLLVAAAYAGKGLSSLLAYGAALESTAAANAVLIASDIKRAEFAVAAARAQQIAAQQNLALTTQALYVNEATAASQMAALTGVQRANMAAAAANTQLATATAASSATMTLGAQAATLWGKAVGFATSTAGAATVLLGVFLAGKYAIDKLYEATLELREAEDAESAAKLRQLYATNEHLKSLREQAKAAKAAEEAAKAAKAAHETATADMRKEITDAQTKLQVTRENIGLLKQLKELSLAQALVTNKAEAEQQLKFTRLHRDALVEIAVLKERQKKLDDEINDRALQRLRIEKQIADIHAGQLKPSVGGFSAGGGTVVTGIGAGSGPGVGVSPFNTGPASPGDIAKSWVEKARAVWLSFFGENYKAQEKYVADVAAIWRRGIGRIVEGFGNSFRDGMEGIYRAFSDLMTRMEAEGRNSGVGYSALKYSTAAIAGGLSGYDSANPVTGALSGIAAGSAAGPIGMVIGGLAGLAGGLLGSAKAAREHAAALRKAQAEFQLSLADYARSALGNMSELDKALADARAQYNAMQDAITKAYAGRENETARFAARAEVDAIYAMQQAMLRAADETRRYNEEQDRLAEEARKAAEALAAAAAAAEAFARASAEFQNSLLVRGLTAVGNSRAAEDARRAFTQDMEFSDAQKAGRSPAELDFMRGIHGIENAAITINRQMDDQIAAANASLEATLSGLDAQRTAAEQQLKVLQDQLRVAEADAQKTQQVIDSLRTFADALKLGNLTTLSPVQQLAEAKAQYEALAARAMGGDKDAALGLGSAAQTFLEKSRAVNASSVGYASDFAGVQAMLAALTDRYGTQLTYEQQVLSVLRQQVTMQQNQIATLANLAEAARANAASQIAAIRAEAQRQLDILAQQLEVLRAQLAVANAMASGWEKVIKPVGKVPEGPLPLTQSDVAQAVSDGMGRTVTVMAAGFQQLTERMNAVEQAIEGVSATVRKTDGAQPLYV